MVKVALVYEAHMVWRQPHSSHPRNFLRIKLSKIESKNIFQQFFFMNNVTVIINLLFYYNKNTYSTKATH